MRRRVIDEVACGDLCTAIIKQALLDWVTLRRGDTIENVSQQELLRFFRSKWAKAMSGDVNPMKLLRQVDVLLDEGVPRGGVSAW